MYSLQHMYNIILVYAITYKLYTYSWEIAGVAGGQLDFPVQYTPQVTESIFDTPMQLFLG